MSGPIKHSTTGLGVGNKIQLRGQRRGVMNIHVVGGLNGCCLKELWPAENSLDIKRQLFLSPPHPFQMSMSKQHNGQGLVCPRVTPKIPTSTLFFFFFLLLICQQIWAGKFVGKVVLSRMANKQSHHCAGWSTLQHFRHLFHLTACLTSAGCILLTQDSVSWTGIGPYRDTMEAFLLFPASSPSCERRASGKGIIQHMRLCFFVCVRNPLWVIFPYADKDLHLHL